jgi:hypothetical protein
MATEIEATAASTSRHTLMHAAMRREHVERLPARTRLSLTTASPNARIR